MRRNSRSAAERVQEHVQHSGRGSGPKSDPPVWVKPQLTELVKQPPDGPDWFHEIKFDGYRMHARIDGGDVRLLTRTGLDWTRKYPPIAAALKELPVRTAYLDGELCGVRPDGTTSFSIIQAASDSGNADALVFFLFDLLFLDGEDLTGLPLSERKSRLATVMSGVGPPLQYSDHQVGRGPTFYAEACKLGLEGIVSKRADAPYVPGDRGLWVKTKCLNREEFVVVGWTDPEGLGHIWERSFWPITTSGQAGLRRTSGHRYWTCGARKALATAPTARDRQNAPGPAAATRKPIWLAAGAFAGALGPTGTRRRGQVLDVDAGRTAASGDLPRAAGR